MPEVGANARLREFFQEYPKEMVFADIIPVAGEPEPNIWLPPDGSVRFAAWMVRKGYAPPEFESHIRGWVNEWKSTHGGGK